MITVVMTTYAPANKPERADYARQAVRSLLINLQGPGRFKLHIADDGSYNIDYIRNLRVAAASYWLTDSTTSNSQRKGIGASLNLAMKQVDNYWLYTTDDWLLTSQLDLSHAKYLLDYEGYDMVRLGPIHPFLWCLTKYTAAGWHLQIDAKWAYAFATRPFLAKRSLYDKVGPFDENLDVYDTETKYSQRVMSLSDKINIAFDGNLPLLGPWQHIGEVEVGHDR